ncbi:hypothetical protein [Sphingomonas sp. ERG5]|uniref:hypothetical protein n=1 Tax=Sphingomonas sp. ERG5 TaxID=1381597 RepID=UPI00054C6245|nr:hypothetical protein [Sphingomonas sp. ERG5]
MSKRRASIPAGQFAFSFDPPAPARNEADLAGLDAIVAATVSRMLEGHKRPVVAAEMSMLLSTNVSWQMLDGYSSEARDQVNISASRLLALVAVTDRFDLLDSLVRRIGASVLVGNEILAAELGHIDRQMAALKARRRSIEAATPIIERNSRS